ncbi:MAG: hypothetical protein RL076_1146 [Chloroflexota bacterium]|jgi:rubrerythrin
MNMSEQELRELFTSASMGQVAYRAWAVQARRERRFNIARLFDALCEARGARAMRAFMRIGGVEATLQNVEHALHGDEPQAVAMQRITGTSVQSRELLGRAARAIAQNRDLLADEIGDLYVCTTCGETREGVLAGACAVCDTVPEAHKAFLAIETMGTLGPHAIMHALEHSEQTLRAMLQELDESVLANPGAENAPSLKEVLGHLNDMNLVFCERVRLILDTDNPELPSAHPPRLNAAAHYRGRPIAIILEAFHDSRRECLLLLRGLTSAAWHRPATHVTYGKINLLHQGNWMVQHERAHLVEMAQQRHDLLVQAGHGQLDANRPDLIGERKNEGE